MSRTPLIPNVMNEERNLSHAVPFKREARSAETEQAACRWGVTAVINGPEKLLSLIIMSMK